MNSLPVLTERDYDLAVVGVCRVILGDGHVLAALGSVRDSVIERHRRRIHDDRRIRVGVVRVINERADLVDTLATLGRRLGRGDTRDRRGRCQRPARDRVGDWGCLVGARSTHRWGAGAAGKVGVL
jgi:hypothetical protein